MLTLYVQRKSAWISRKQPCGYPHFPYLTVHYFLIFHSALFLYKHHKKVLQISAHHPYFNFSLLKKPRKKPKKQKYQDRTCPTLSKNLVLLSESFWPGLNVKELELPLEEASEGTYLLFVLISNLF